MIHLAALDGEPGFEGLAANFPRPLDDSTAIGRTMLLKQVVQIARAADSHSGRVARHQLVAGRIRTRIPGDA
jgi:hypothetical protein